MIGKKLCLACKKPVSGLSSYCDEHQLTGSPGPVHKADEPEALAKEIGELKGMFTTKKTDL